MHPQLKVTIGKLFVKAKNGKEMKRSDLNMLIRGSEYFDSMEFEVYGLQNIALKTNMAC